jgi:hypothetical protein
VLFPVDWIDHDAAARQKRLCTKQATPYIPLRSASVASFAAGRWPSSTTPDRRAPKRAAR